MALGMGFSRGTSFLRFCVLYIKRPGAGCLGITFSHRRILAIEGGMLMATAFFRTIILYLLLIAGLRLTGTRQIDELERLSLRNIL